MAISRSSSRSSSRCSAASTRWRQSVSEVNTKLDRNCAILKDISLGLRLHDIREFNLLQNVPHGARNGVAFGSFPNVTC